METEGKIISGNKAKWYEFLQTMRGAHLVHKRMVDLMTLNCKEEVLDVGCGPGTVLFLLNRKCGKSIKLHGIDPSEDMIRIAERKNTSRNSGIQFSVGMGEKLEFEDNRFDLIVSSLTFHHLPSDTKRKTAQEIRRVLKPSGRIYISDWGRPRNWLGRIISATVKKHAFTEENLQGLVVRILQEAGFREVETIGVQFAIIEHITGIK